MNKQIEKLMLEATKDMPQGYYVSGEYFEKFAKLIAWECIGLCNSIEKIDGVAWECSDAIKQHFGIKE